MTRVRVEGFTISLDGYGAGPNQDIRNPLGVGGTDLHQWYSRHARSNGPCLAPTVAQRGSMTTSLRGASRMLAPGFSEETCSDRFAVPGPT